GDTGALEDAVDNFVDDVLAELAQLPKPLESRRCTGDTRKGCTVSGDCSGVGGTCEYWFGAPLPLSAGGVDTCVLSQFSGSVTGTANVDTGSSAGAASVISRVYQGAAANSPCPKCLGDGTPNDGIRGGTCNAGVHSGLSCDVNGIAGARLFSPTSLDCGPLGASIVASLPIDLTNTTGTRTKTLTTASPNCRAVGHTTEKCFCDTCGGGSNNAGPCAADSDCPGGGVCGGKRCQSGANNGAVCTVTSECPGGGCGVPGTPTQPNKCDDGTCSAAPGNSGECAGGPTEFFCSPVNRTQGCLSDGDCSVAGDTCTRSHLQFCYTDNGAVGNSVTSVGLVSVPVNHESDPILASEFCIAPTAAPAVNNAAGLPSLG